MSISIRTYLLTFATRKNVRALIDEIFANYTKNNVLHIIFTHGMFLHVDVSFCDVLRFDGLVSVYKYYLSEYGVIKYFEQLLTHHTFIEHITSVQQMDKNARNRIESQQRLVFDQMDAIWENSCAFEIDASTFNDAVDCDIIPDYICIEEITTFVKFVLNHFDAVGRNVLSRCVNDEYFATSITTQKTFYEHIHYTLEQNFVEHPPNSGVASRTDGEMIRRLCNTIPYTDFAGCWHVKKRAKFAFLCESVYEQYGYEQNKEICHVLCDEYVMHVICRFL